jgi:hypothetical protein
MPYTDPVQRRLSLLVFAASKMATDHIVSTYYSMKCDVIVPDCVLLYLSYVAPSIHVLSFLQTTDGGRNISNGLPYKGKNKQQ